MIQAYNYLLGSYPVKKEVMYRANKRSELKKVYNDIVDLSKRTPYCKINLSKENEEYAIRIKEYALELKAKINNIQDSQASSLSLKTVAVSDESILSAKLIGEDTSGLPEAFQIKVDSLASVQINRGKDLLADSYAFPPGKYNFNVTVMDKTYSLTYNQPERMPNSDTLKNVAEFLEQNIPELGAFVEKGEAKNYYCITIASDMSGRFGDRTFHFEDLEDYKQGISDFLGLNRTEQAAAYAQFEIDGANKQAATNTFTLDNKIHITLHKSSDEPVTVKIVPDSDKILKDLDKILSTYNNMIGLAKERKLENEEHYSASRLIHEMENLTKGYDEELTACGIEADEDGKLEMDDFLATQAARDGGMESLLKRENGFIARLMDKAEAIAINPMEYLEKTIITYPDQNKNTFSNPYITSMYSGLFFNSYC